MEIYSLDIGGSSIKHAIVMIKGEHCEITDRLPKIDLGSNSFSELRKKIISAVDTQARKIGGPINVAISTTGGVARSGLVWNAGHFEGYTNIDWHVIFQSELPTLIDKVITINDGKASTWAEYQRIGLGTEVFVHFVVGSGVGGGIVFFDKLVYGDEETAGALGHMKVGGESEIICSCRHKNCVETLASSQAIARFFKELIRKDGRNNDTQITFEETAFEARNGNQLAIRAFEIAGEWLGIAISNIINVLNPRYITVGGGVILASSELSSNDGGPYLSSAIRRSHELAFKDVAEETIIRSASAGNDGGLLGAAMLCAAAVPHEK